MVIENLITLDDVTEDYPKQVCEDLVNTANGIIDTLELDMEIKSVEKKSDISKQDLSDSGDKIMSEQDESIRWGNFN